MGSDLRFCLGDMSERPVPTRLQFTRDQPVCRVGNVILAKGAICGIPRGIEIACESLSDLIASLACLASAATAAAIAPGSTTCSSVASTASSTLKPCSAGSPLSSQPRAQL
jgi:hypothetical protein